MWEKNRCANCGQALLRAGCRSRLWPVSTGGRSCGFDRGLECGLGVFWLWSGSWMWSWGLVALIGVLNVVLGSYGGFSGLHQQYKLKFSIEKRKQEYRMSATEYLNMKLLQENRFDEGRRLTNMWLWQKGISSSFNQCIFLPKPMYVIHGTDLRWFDKKNSRFNLIYRSNKQVLQMMLTLPLVAHFFNANFVEIWMFFFFSDKNH